ncbi:SMI1/KNR4 family protein [Enhygromyxa salina]|uniref:Knr4/Smi1-like domain-containing protein n=1 Tax=Enhygromyxa salina TaxID=215803 RepID=A0A2S9XLF8_9BACT|nr:SMI1/KNR4 family protein [Enhygromyxa salina]PRP93716.1 hypothetical protein ENSA7_81440 [Enhygromyxa salina]
MRPQDLEPELDELLLRIVPDLGSQWRGATEHEIDQIEQIAGRPLPRFYRWFLMRMGHDMGPIEYRSMIFSAPTVLQCYAERLFVPHPRFLMIAYETDEMMPLHLLYDFNFPARDDARVIKGHALGGEGHPQFETFREMFAWGEVGARSVESRAQKIVCSLSDPGGDVLAHLDPVMKSLGFEAPISTGPRCGVYHRADAGLVSFATVTRPSNGPGACYHIFHLGANDHARIRQILGEIVAETPLELEIEEWDPPL